MNKHNEKKFQSANYSALSFGTEVHSVLSYLQIIHEYLQ